MAGHSKWANIKFRKSAQDARRGKVFCKLIKEITIAARIGGPDSGSNPRLRTAVDKGLAANMTRDAIQRAVKRGSGEFNNTEIVEALYEGYAPHGVAVLVECATDNRNRAVSEIRHAFSKCSGNLGTDGSVSYLFDKIGSIVFSSDLDEERIMEIALEFGADDIDGAEGMIEVITAPEHYLSVEQALKDAGFVPEMSELIHRPTIQVDLDDPQSEQVAKLVDILEQLDDVQNVFTNAVLPRVG